MNSARKIVNPFSGMHCANFAQSKAIDKCLKSHHGSFMGKKNKKPIYRKIPGTDLHYDDILLKWSSKRSNAHKRGITYALSPVSIMNMLRAKRCYYTGVELTGTVKPGERQKPSSFTIDRIDCRIGYVPGNVVACCRAVNEIKGHAESSSGGLLTAVEMKLVICQARALLMCE